MTENYTEGLIFTKNLDDKGTPFTPKLVEVGVVSNNGKIQCKQNIYKKNGISLISPTNLRKVSKPELIANTSNSYFIYEDRGEVLFSEDLIGQVIVFEYYGTGTPNIGDCRVYTTIDNNGNITETLNGLLKENRKELDAIIKIGGGIIVLNKLEELIKNAEILNIALGVKITVGNALDKTLKDTIKAGNDTDDKVRETIRVANETDTKLNNTITTGTLLDTSLKSNIVKGNEVDSRLKATIVEGEGLQGELAEDMETMRDLVDAINVSDNKVVKIEVADWTLNSATGRYEKLWKHDMNKTTLIFEYMTLKNGKKCSYFMDYEIQDENNVKFITESNDIVFVVATCRYYTGLNTDESTLEIDKMIDGVNKVVMTKDERTLLNSHSSQLEDKANESDLVSANSKIINNTNNINSLQTQIGSVASGSPKGVYATVSALTTAFPSGNPNIYVVSADGGWYYWNGTIWYKGGIYQSTGVADNSVDTNKVSFNLPYSLLTTSTDVFVDTNAKVLNVTLRNNASNIVFYIMRDGKIIKNYDLGLATFKKTINNWETLVFDTLNNTFVNIPYNTLISKTQVVLLENCDGKIGGGIFSERANRYSKEWISFDNPNTLYTQTLVNGWIYFKIDGSVTINPYGFRFNFNNLCGRNSTSWEGVTNCFYLRTNETLVYDRVTNTCEIRSLSNTVLTDIVIIQNLGGTMVSTLIPNKRLNDDNYTSKVKGANIPKYLEDIVKQKTKSIINNQIDSLDRINIGLLADSHQSEFDGCMYSRGASLMNKLKKSLALETVISCGDNIIYNTSKELALMYHADFSNKLEVEMLYAVGNHDGNGWDNSPIQQASTMISNKELYLAYCKHLKNINWGSKQDMYYYKDIENIRIIILNSNDTPFIVNSDGTIKYNSNFVYGYRQEQLKWLCQVALNTDRHCLIVSHIPPVGHYEGMYYNFEKPINYLQLRSILEAFKNGTSVTVNNTTTDKSEFNINFSHTFSKQGNVIGVFSGHLHCDNNVVINSIRYITSNCDWARNWVPTLPDINGSVWDIPYRGVNESSELCCDILSIDTLSKNVKITRFGVGNDREFNY